MSVPLRILVVDDSADDCHLSLRALERASFVLDWKRVDDEQGLRAALAEREWQVVLLDQSMPKFDGATALAIVRAQAPETIPIVVSGSIGEERAVETIRQGASDYILKDRLLRLPAAVSRELNQSAERRARVEAERRVREMARRDAVTGLPNRAVLEEIISRRLNTQESAPPFAVAVIDIDAFAEIRRAFGHAVSDDVLRLVARRLEAARPRDSVLVSLGAHDFGLLLENADCNRALAACESARALFDEPLVLGGVPIPTEASIGIALHPGDGDHASLLLRHASLAMTDARKRGRAIASFSPDKHGSESDQLILLGELRSAIDTSQIHLEYQPVIDLRSGDALGVESLVRWEHPRRGRVPPGSFVPQAENSGLIGPLTAKILRTAIAWNAEALENGLELSVAVNFATRNLLDPRIVAVVSDELARVRLPAHRLEIEITESALMNDPAGARETLARLCELGVHLAIDDFGTGYSSFAYLRDLPVQKIKIDRSFVAALTQSKSDASIVQGIIELGHTLGLTVAAEGIEDEFGYQLLSALGCDVAQGFYMGKPMPPDALPAWRSRWQTRHHGDLERARDRKCDG